MGAEQHVRTGDFDMEIGKKEELGKILQTSVETSGARESLRGCDICHKRFRISGKMC